MTDLLISASSLGHSKLYSSDIHHHEQPLFRSREHGLQHTITAYNALEVSIHFISYKYIYIYIYILLNMIYFGLKEFLDITLVLSLKGFLPH